MRPVKRKNLVITLILAFFIWGLGHIYLGFVKRGIIVLIVGFAIGIVLSIIVPFPYSLVLMWIYGIWNMYDAYKHYKKINPPSFGR
jgi:TM2 domain-containing membrane protein YozV